MGDLKLAAFCVQHASFMNDNIKSKSLLDDEVASVYTRGGSSKYRGTIDTSTAVSSMTNATLIQSQSVTQRALVFSFLKKHDKAINVLEQELKIKATTSIYNLLGRVFMKAKRWADAVNAFQKSIDLNVIFFCYLQKIFLQFFSNFKSLTNQKVKRTFRQINRIRNWQI